MVNFELLPSMPQKRAPDNPWPNYPRTFKVDYGHAEILHLHGKDPREFSILSKEFVGDAEGRVTGIKAVRVKWNKDNTGKWSMKEDDECVVFPCDLVLLALGFTGPEQTLCKSFGITLSNRGLISCNPAATSAKSPPFSPLLYQTSISKVFSAGDCRRGQSLIVWGINEGRQAAREMDLWLMHNTQLPICGGGTCLPHTSHSSIN